jgi:ABC-2 type transport system ATP-binding protein
VLDEPLSGIDPVGRQEFLALFAGLAESGKCLLISSHELDALEKLTDHVAIMARGRLAAVGTLARIRDLLDEHPVAVRIDTDQPRELASRLLDRPDVLGVEFLRGPATDAADGPPTSLVVRARRPREFYPWFQRLVIEEGLNVRHLETLDESAESLLGYLLGGRR